MTDQRSDTPEAFIHDMRTAIRSDVERSYTERIFNAQKGARRAQDEADADTICRDREKSAARMAEYRRGRWYHLGAIIASGCAGFVGGYMTQKNVDLRVEGAPVVAVGGLPTLAFGARLDESLWTRACLAVGGAMFSVGAVTFVRCNPEPTNILILEDKP